MLTASCRPLEHLIHVALEHVSVGAADVLVHAAGHGARTVHPLARGDADHLLPELAQQHALFCDIGVGERDADDVAQVHLGVEAEQQVGRRQVEEVQRMRLHDLPVVHQAADLFGAARDGGGAEHHVHRLRRRQVMRHRADAAQPLHHHRHFPVGPAFDELLEAAKLDDVQPHLLHAALFVEQDRHLAMALDTGHGVDGHAAQALRRSGGFEIEAHGDQLSSVVCQQPWPRRGVRPAMRSVRKLQNASAEGGQPGRT